MSTIPISLTENEFEAHINPCLRKAKRGFVCSIPLYKVFNYILYRLHTGCQWDQLPIDPDPHDPEKKRSVGMRCITTIANGHVTAVGSGFGSTALTKFDLTWR